MLTVAVAGIAISTVMYFRFHTLLSGLYASYLTLYLSLCGLTGESIIPWGLGLSGLVRENAHPCLSYFIKSPPEGTDIRSIHRFLIYTVGHKKTCPFIFSITPANIHGFS